MDLWDLEDIDLIEPAFIEFDQDRTGHFRFIAVEGFMDWRYGPPRERPAFPSRAELHHGIPYLGSGSSASPQADRGSTPYRHPDAAGASTRPFPGTLAHQRHSPSDDGSSCTRDAPSAGSPA